MTANFLTSNVDYSDLYRRGESHFSQKWRLANVGESGEYSVNGLANVGKFGESAQHGLANVGESGESAQHGSAQAGMIR
jgi:hypothetical protein